MFTRHGYRDTIAVTDDFEKIELIYWGKSEPLIAPEAIYEMEAGFRNNVIFPSGLIVEDSGEVKIYYGAADTTQCLAMAQLDELIEFCLSFR